MNVLINIPDHLYDLLKDLPSDSNEGTIENVLMKAVENGIPLEQIRAEIQENINYNKNMNYQGIVAGLLLTLDIIDKYKEQTE